MVDTPLILWTGSQTTVSVHLAVVAIAWSLVGGVRANKLVVMIATLCCTMIGDAWCYSLTFRLLYQIHFCQVLIRTSCFRYKSVHIGEMHV